MQCISQNKTNEAVDAQEHTKSDIQAVTNSVSNKIFCFVHGYLSAVQNRFLYNQILDAKVFSQFIQVAELGNYDTHCFIVGFSIID